MRCARNLPLVAALAATLFSSQSVLADRYRPDGRYSAAVPAPAAILGFEPGDRPTRYQEVVHFAETIASTSPRVRLVRYAKSHEGRDLLLLIIASETNVKRLEAIRDDVGKIAEPRNSIGGKDLASLLDRTPAIAYLAYSIHGDELSGTDAALRVAYELAAGETEDVKKLLENLVILIDPTENPDGRERILAMNAAYQGSVPNADPDALSHSGLWPWGRGNHYLFDLNRDWFVQVHPESRGRADLLRTWRPQLVVDSHEMGFDDTYLFNPPRDPQNPNLPSTTQLWWERFAADQARAFDQRGWSYYTGEWCDEFYPGYGSSVALYQGAVGILYEQAATDGQPIRKSTGRIAEYAEAVAHQFTSSLANLGTAAAHRRDLLQAYRGARAEAIARGGRGGQRVVYFAPRPDPARADRLATRLARLGIEVERLEAPATLTGARSTLEGAAGAARLPAGSYRVRFDQPDGLLARAILEPHVQLPDSTLAREREQLERQKGTRLYDVTAWSPLLASGLESWWSSRLDGLRWSRIDPAREIGADRGGVTGDAGGYGWVFDGATDGALGLAAKLADRGFMVRVGEKPLPMRGSVLGRGAFLLRAEDNPSATADTLRALAVGTGVQVIPVATARVPGDPDLGGGYWPLIRPARIAILAGQPLNFTSVGWAWNLIDQEMQRRVSLLDVARVARADLERYNVLVVPPTWGRDEVERALGSDGIKALRTWAENGGTLIAVGTSAEFFADSASHFSAVRLRRQALKEFPAPSFGLSEEAVRALEKMQAMGLGTDGRHVASLGAFDELDWARALGVPGNGLPLLGSGARAWLGLPAAAPALTPPGGRPSGAKAQAKEGAEESKSAPSDEEAEKASKKTDDRLRRFLPTGAIVRVDLDTEHWLAYGCGKSAAVMADDPEAFLARDPATTVGRFASPSELHLGGLLWPEAAGRMAHTAFLTRESVGKGQLILFAGDPNFRGYFWGSERLFLNASLLGPGLGTAHTIPW